MARHEYTVLVDDLDDDYDGVQTVDFTLEGTEYQIDLSEQNRRQLWSDLERYIHHARKVGPTDRRKPRELRDVSPRPKKGTPFYEAPADANTRSRRRFAQLRKQMREDLRASGWAISDRGRIPQGAADAWVSLHYRKAKKHPA